MADWSNPEPFQLQALHEALLFAYPTPADLNTFLVFNLGKSYDGEAPGAFNYRNGLTAILMQARGDGWLDELVQKVRRDRPRSPKLLLLDGNLPLTAVEVPEPIHRNLEDIVRNDGGFQNLIPWVERLVATARRTCRIECPVNTARGTGWLVGADLLLTNWHVIEDALPGGQQQANDFICRFDYATMDAGTTPGIEVRFAQDWNVDASPPSSAELGTGHDAPTPDTLDYALIRLDTPIGNGMTPTGGKRGWVTASDVKSAPNPGDIVFVIQYPDGLPLKLALGTVGDISTDKLRIFHTANTQGGSSGAVVVNPKLEPVGLHHAGDSLYHRGKIGNPERNQAIPIGLIFARLRNNGHLN